MPVETLEFEEPIVLLLKEIETLGLQPRTDARDREIASLRRRIDTVRAELYRFTPRELARLAVLTAVLIPTGLIGARIAIQRAKREGTLVQY